MANEFEQIISAISGIFRIPEAWLGFPAFFTHLLIPFILVSYAFYKLLQKLKIFGYHTGIYTVLSFIFAFVLLPIGPVVAIAAAGFIGVFGMETWRSRIIFIAILIAAYFLIYSVLPTIKF
ncbi:MAG TPA: hypothetical protein VJJ76_02325 [archaeon]|nr:hypothetical protein [archaeon]